MKKSIEERVAALEKKVQEQTDRTIIVLKKNYKKHILYDLLHFVELLSVFILTAYNIFSR